MKNLICAVVITLGSTAAWGQMPAQPAPGLPAAPAGQWTPIPPKGQDGKGLNDTIKGSEAAWARLDAAGVSATWQFPATIFTTDSQGNPVTATVDENGLKTALGAAFASIPKPNPGEVAANVKCTGKPPVFLSNNLAIADSNCVLNQGKGKTMIHKQWMQSAVWSREAAGWRVRGFSASGLGSLLAH